MKRFLETLTQKIFILVLKIHNFQGELTDSSANMEALVVIVGGAVFAEILLRSPRKLFIFIIKK